MNGAEQILNRYGLTMVNQEYEKNLLYRMGYLAKHVDKRKGENALREEFQEKLLRGIAWVTEGIYINDLELFKQIFEVHKTKTKIPTCLFSIVQFYASPSVIENPFAFGVTHMDKTKPIVDKYLEKKNEELIEWLRGYRLATMFAEEQDKKDIHIEISCLVIDFAKEINETAAKKKLQTELIEYFLMKFEHLYRDNGNYTI